MYLLEHIKHVYTRIVFVSNSPVSGDSQIKLEKFCDDIIIRENRGFDFGAWKDAILKEGWEKLSQYDNVTLMNDSCFGPIFDPLDIYVKMERENIGFWGLTLHEKTNYGMPGTNDPIPHEHIQSYFMCFNNSVISSFVFRDFWTGVEYLTDINKVISRYETKLTSLLSNNGFKYSVKYAPNPGSNITYPNIATMHPDLIIRNDIPFLKIKSFVYFPYQKYIIDLIQKKTNYPVNLIYDHVTEVFNPNLSLQICDKLVPAIPAAECIANISVAIHLHVFYLDVFEIYLDYLNNIPVDFDLYITTDTLDKKSIIRELIKNSGTEKHLKEIFITGNKGRDILPWLGISDVLGKYDIAGHFHTKKTVFAEEWLGITWQQDILELLLVPINKIIDEFSKNSNLGIVIPEIPTWGHIKPYLPDENGQKIINSSLNELWKKSKNIKEIDFSGLKTIIMPYGNMFWYRPASLQSFFQIHLTSDDFDPEPLKNDLTIVHFIERILVYCAWNNGFDYRIMVFSPPKISNFIDHMILQDANNSINSIKGSITYRTGRFILAIPKMIKNVFFHK
jgi:rhamnosyltransferase